jgi:hypothetical protein
MPTALLPLFLFPSLPSPPSSPPVPLAGLGLGSPPTSPAAPRSPALAGSAAAGSDLCFPGADPLLPGLGPSSSSLGLGPSPAVRVRICAACDRSHTPSSQIYALGHHAFGLHWNAASSPYRRAVGAAITASRVCSTGCRVTSTG